jgi:hypothetical protein
VINEIDCCTYLGDRLTACGSAVVPGRSYCEVHLWQVYQKGTNLRTRHKDLRQAESVWNIEDVMNEVIQELQDEGVL